MRISIHALRKESDVPFRVYQMLNYSISIHALRKESDLPLFVKLLQLAISIHALRKESDVFAVERQSVASISIHALRKESDIHVVFLRFDPSTFQSTLSVRRATAPVVGHLVVDDISIHALRKESDEASGKAIQANGDFNPRSP